MSCVAAVRSALLEVKGVKRAQVTLEQSDAVVTYDPRQANVQDLIAAVNAAEGPSGPSQFKASLKNPSSQGASAR